ncbi:MAG: cell division protein ZapB [Thermodesulfobacteriota bacterium]|nr:cell division protein ZapB [Thermodesulfobacteriota bacterium]
MEQDSIPEQFGRLEEKVGQLVDRCHTLERAKADLEAKIRHLEEVVRSKDAAEEQHVEEKGMIKSRIDHLLSRLDQAVDSDGTPLKTETFST